MPFIEHTGVSRRIENEEERARLKEALNEIRLEGKGVIARTVAEGQSLKTLRADHGVVQKIWKDLEKVFKKGKFPRICYEDLPFIHRVMRDITDENVDRILIDDEESVKSAEKFATKYLPGIKGKS